MMNAHCRSQRIARDERSLEFAERDASCKLSDHTARFFSRDATQALPMPSYGVRLSVRYDREFCQNE